MKKSHAGAQIAQVMSCDFCRNNHSREKCPLQAKTTNYIGNYNWNREIPIQTPTTLVWRNHPNFGWAGNQVSGQKPRAQDQTPLRFQTNAQNRQQHMVEKKLSMEVMFLQFMQMQQK